MKGKAAYGVNFAWPLWVPIMARASGRPEEMGPSVARADQLVGFF